MAKDKKDTKKEAKPKGAANNTTRILLVLIALAIGLAAANTWLLLDTRKIAMSASAGVSGEVTQQQASEPVFVTVDPFTVNLASDQFGPRLLYLGMTLEVEDGYTKNTLLNNMTQARSRLLVLLSGKEAETISNSDGKRALAEEVKTELKRPYGSSSQELEIHDVLFTEFIVQ